MRLELDNNFYVESDAESFTLHYENPTGKFGENGVERVSRNQWHYPNIRRCLESYLDKVSGIMNTDASNSAAEILSKYNEVVRKIGSYSELAWSEKDTKIYQLNSQIKDLKQQLKQKK